MVDVGAVLKWLAIEDLKDGLKRAADRQALDEARRRERERLEALRRGTRPE